MFTIFLALGSNLGDSAANLRSAVAGLSRSIVIEALSSVYETAPMYVTDQPAFLNMALRAATDLEPLPLLRLVKGLEQALGRQAGRRFGPRLIDIDILFHGDTVLVTPELEIPHPRLAERAFVLCPLTELAPDLRHPVLGATIAALAEALPDTASVRRLGPLAGVAPDA